jgi:N-acetylated-alpha-linked acidic dipeptidase
MSVWQRARLARISDAKEKDRKEIRERDDLRIGALGSGTDYTAFVDHLGVPSLNLSFGGEDDGGIYHSIYDDFYWYMHFSDRDFIYGRALAQTVGSTVMRLADADLAPYKFTNFADTVQMYIKQLKDLLKAKQDEITERNLELSEGVFTAINDPRRPKVAPRKEEVPPHLNFAPLENAADQLTRSAKRYDAAVAAALASGKLSAAELQRLNLQLLQSEHRLTDDKGLPRRPYYKHLIYAPGVYTGYGPKTMAGVREGIEQKRYAEAESEGMRIATALQNEAELLDSISAELEKLQSPASSATPRQ